jgi:hypothetical protein
MDYRKSEEMMMIGLDIDRYRKFIQVESIGRLGLGKGKKNIFRI